MVVCARCGTAGDVSVGRCGACDGRFAVSVLDPVLVDPYSTGITAASSARRVVSSALAVIIPVLIGCAVIATSTFTDAGTAVLLGVGTALLVGAVQLAVWVHRGRSIGSVLTATRTVRVDDGTALSWRGLAGALRARPPTPMHAGATRGAFSRWAGTLTVSVSGNAVDPLALSRSRVPDLPARRVDRYAATAHRAVWLTFDGRLRVPLVHSVILGRDPVAAGPDSVPVAVPDLSRLISKAHVRLDREGDRVLAVDLDSTNGTELVVNGTVRTLQAGERVEVPPGAHLLLAGHALRVEQREASLAA